MEKRLFVQLNGNRKVIGVLRGYDVRDSPKSHPSGVGSLLNNGTGLFEHRA